MVTEARLVRALLFHHSMRKNISQLRKIDIVEFAGEGCIEHPGPGRQLCSFRLFGGLDAA